MLVKGRGRGFGKNKNGRATEDGAQVFVNEGLLGWDEKFMTGKKMSLRKKAPKNLETFE